MVPIDHRPILFRVHHFRILLDFRLRMKPAENIAGRALPLRPVAKGVEIHFHAYVGYRVPVENNTQPPPGKPIPQFDILAAKPEGRIKNAEFQ